MRATLERVASRLHSRPTLWSRGLRARLVVWLGAGLATLASAATNVAEATPRAIVIAPYDASSLAADEQWMGEAVAQVISLGLVWQQGLVQIEPARFRSVVDPIVWDETHVAQAARAVRADTALYGTIVRKDSGLLLQPRLLDLKSGQPTPLPPMAFTEAETVAQLASLAGIYAQALLPALTGGERTRIERAARPTSSLPALELFARGQTAFYDGDNTNAVDLLVRAVEADQSFAPATLSLGVVHAALGNRWKAAALFRATFMLDSKMPEPFKALGDLYLSVPRNLFDQAIEAYSKAIELRPFYADAHAGLGDAHIAKGDVSLAVEAYQRAIAFDPFNPRTHVRLGRAYAAKGRCTDAANEHSRAGELDPHYAAVPAPCPTNTP
jgi:tetratricopeptide (TPR) repeat protein